MAFSILNIKSVFWRLIHLSSYYNVETTTIGSLRFPILSQFEKETFLPFSIYRVKFFSKAFQKQIFPVDFFLHIFFNCGFPLLLPSQKNG